jgi:hypothetical protein
MKSKTPEEKVAKALEQALDLTTVTRPGVPWEHPDREKNDSFSFRRDYPEWF